MIINEFAESRTEEKNMEEKQIQIPDVNADAEERDNYTLIQETPEDNLPRENGIAIRYSKDFNIVQANELLRSNSPKKWFRAYFNHGLINYLYGQKRLLPCDMSFDTFFIDPYGDVMPCNGTKDKEVMGNLNNQTWDELWNSPEAEKVRAKVRCCDRDCWMIGSVSPAMHKYIWKPAIWVLVHKFKALFTKHPYSMYELKICRDYRDGKVTKEDLDKCSTCDMNCVINNGLSEASKEQLKHKTGEEIVDADIAQQMETK